MSGRRGHAIAIGVLVVLPLVFFWAMVIEGQEPLAPDTQAAKPFTHWGRETQAELGTQPLWCPGIFAGMPAYGSFIYMPSGTLDLLRLPRALLGDNRGARYFLGMVIGGISLYLLLIVRHRSPLAALTGAVAYTLMPYVLGLIAAGHSTKLQALYLAPLVFLAVELLLARRSLAATALLAVAVALQLWRNHPQISYYTLLLAALYGLGVLLWDRPPAWRGRGLLVGGILAVVALGLAAGLVMEPYGGVMEYKPYSIRGGSSALDGDTAGGGDWEYATSWSYPPQELVCFLFPAWFGLEGQTYWGMLPFTQSTHYIGVTVLGLALLGVVLGTGRRRWILLGLGALVILIGFGRHFAVLYRPMYELLPLFKSFRVPSMIYALLSLPSALLAAGAVDAIRDPARWEKPRPRRAARQATGPLRSWTAVTLALLALLLLWLVAGGALASALRGGGAFVSDREAAQLGPEGVAAVQQMTSTQLETSSRQGGFAAVVVERVARWRQTVTIGLLFLLLPALVIEGRRRGRLKGELAAALLLAVVIADLWIIDRKFYDPRPRRQAESILEADETIRFLQQQPGLFRVAPLAGGEFGSNRYAAFNLESVGGYQPAKLQIYDDLMRAGAVSTLPVLSMLNVRYLLSDQDLSAAGLPLAGRTRLRTGGEVGVYENPHVLPRAWFVTEIREAPTAAALLDQLRAERFNPAQTVWILEGQLPAVPDSLGQGVVRAIDRPDLHHLNIAAAVTGTQAGLLVISEIDYPPGWEVTIDGEPQPIMRVNHVLRSVWVPPGEHRIEWRAVSPGRAWGQRLSWAAGTVVLVLLAGAWWERRRRVQPASQAGA